MTDDELPDLDLGPLPELPSLDHLGLGDWFGDGAAAAAPPPERYEVLGELGRGGMGVVELARDREIGREIAIKRLIADSPTKESLGRFMEEAQITGQLEHPNICPVHELGLDRAGRLYFAMKRVKGRSLADGVAGLWEEGEEFPLLERLEVFRKVCDAIVYAHSRGVIHRDLKPANVMVGEFGEVLVMDWGLAKILGRRGREGEDRVLSDRSLTGVGLTMEGKVAGTAIYMSPEQARGEVDEVDERSDIYSLGGILYEIVTGTPPYLGDSAEKILIRVSRGHLEPPGARMRRLGGSASEVPRELEAIILKAMNSHPNRRYHTAAALRGDVDNFICGRPVRAMKSSPAEDLWRWARSHRALAGGLAAAILSVVAGLVGFIWIRTASSARLREADLQAAHERKVAREAAEQTVVREQEAALRKEAEALYGRGRSLRAEAGDLPFRPDAPHEWFQAQLSALSAMGRGLLAYPGSPPGAWRSEVDAATAEVQGRAEEIGHWAMAAHVARLAGVWGAIDATERDRRIARARTAQGEAEAADLQALDAILADLGKVRLPGLLREMELRVKRLRSRTAVTERILAKLLDRGRDWRAASLERQFLIAALGHLDVRATFEEVTPIDLIARSLGGDVLMMPNEELEAWIASAVRLEATHPGVFAKAPLEAILDSVEKRSKASKVDAKAVQAGRKFLRRVRGEAPFPNPAKNAEAYDVATQELGDWLAGTVRSRTAWVGRLLALEADAARYSPRQQAFVLEQLGHFGDVQSPDPARPDRTPRAALRRALSGASALDLAPGAPATSEAALRRAVAASLGLARAGDAASAPAFFAARRAAGSSSYFYWRTRVAAATFPIQPWPEPDRAAGYLVRASAFLARGDRAATDIDLGKARRLEPKNPEVLDAIGSFLAQEARTHWSVATGAAASGNAQLAAQADRAFVQTSQKAIDTWRIAIELSPEDPRLPLHRGEFLFLTHFEQPPPPGDEARRRQAAEWLALARSDLARAWELTETASPDPTQGGAAAYHGRAIGGEEGARLLREAASRNPTLIEAWFFLGLAKLGDEIECFTRVIEIDPYYQPAWTARAKLYRDKGKPGKALDDATRLLEMDPKDFDARVLRAEVRLEQGDPSAAEDFLAAVQLRPSHPAGHRGMALVYSRAGRLDEAAKAFRNALQVPNADAAGWTQIKRLMYETLGPRAEPFIESELKKAPEGLASAPPLLVPGRYRSPWQEGKPGSYRLEGKAGRTVHLVVLSGSGDPAIEMTGPGGWKAANDDRAAHRTDAELRVRLPADGTYELRIDALPNGKGTAYVLELTIE